MNCYQSKKFAAVLPKVAMAVKCVRKFIVAGTTLLVSSSVWAEYIRVGSITSTGSGSTPGQFVNTGIALACDDKIEISFVPTSVSAVGCLFCNRTSSSENTFTMFIASKKLVWHYKTNGSGAKTSEDEVAANKHYVIVANGATGKWYVDDVEMLNSQPPSEFTPGGKLAFFASYDSGTKGNYAAIRFYYAKVWGSDGTLKHHFVPAMDSTKSDGDIDRFGLMDLQNGNAFSPNSGTVPFSRAVAGMRVWAGQEGGDLADSGNWLGSSGDYLFADDAMAILSGDWSLADSIRIDRGLSVTFDIGVDNSITAPAFYYKYDASSAASAYSTVKFLNGTYTFNGSSKNFQPYSADGITTVISNATFSTGGNSIHTDDGVVPAPKDCAMEVLDGAKLTANNISVSGIGNSMKVDGSGTEARSINQIYVGRTTGRDGNRLDVSDGAVVKADSGIVIGGAYNPGAGYSSASNVVVVSGGAMLRQNGSLFHVGRNGDWNILRVKDGGVVSNATDYTLFIGSESSHNSAIVEGAGSLCYSKKIMLGNADTATDNVLFVGDGATLTGRELRFGGDGNSLVVSNATVALDPLGGGYVVTTNATMRFAGTESSLRCHHVNDGSQDNVFAVSSTLEFVVPQDGWSEAPFRLYSGFRMPHGAMLRIDGDSVANYLRAHPRGGKIPLLSCDDNAASVVIDDMDALSAGLPENCMLVVENRTVKLKMKSQEGFILTVH